jgi:hypothetical protein
MLRQKLAQFVLECERAVMFLLLLNVPFDSWALRLADREGAVAGLPMK